MMPSLVETGCSSVQDQIHLVHRDERGMLSMVNVVAVMLGVLLITFVINVGHVTYQKVEMQNSADAVAYTGAVWQARGMNAITATNHVIGEMMSLVIVHESIGGKLLDRDGPIAEDQGSLVSKTIDSGSDLQRINDLLDIAAAASSSTGNDAYRIVRQEEGIKAEATLLDAKVTLKRRLTQVYWTIVAAQIMQKFPPTAAAGQALEEAMRLLEQYIAVEYRILKVLHSAASGLVGMKEILRDRMMPAAKKYTDVVATTVPTIAQQAARKVAERNKTEGTLYPLVPELPVEIDPHAEAITLRQPTDKPVSIPGREAGCCGCPTGRSVIDRDQIVKITQLARATFPWVVYHRQAVIDGLHIVPLSKASDFYKDHTDGYSKHLCDEVQRTTTSQRSVKIQLYVIKDGSAPDKGFEAWTDDPAKADRLFAVVGLAYREPPKVITGGSIFRQQHTDGRLAYAQALLYNANAQVRPEHKIDLTCKRLVPNRQADVGWDTLNWKPGTRPTELVAKWNNGGAPPSVFPEIEVNWQAKLVPGSASRLGQMASTSLPNPFQDLVAKLRLDKQPASNKPQAGDLLTDLPSLADWDLRRLMIEAARLSKDAYESGSSAPQGWKLDGRGTGPLGFAYSVYKRTENGKEIVAISFRGTETDWNGIADDVIATDIWNAIFGSEQYIQAIQATNHVRAKYPDAEIVLTGHSLGGGLASYVAAMTGLPAVAVNAAGPSYPQLLSIGAANLVRTLKGDPAALRNIIHINSRLDPLTNSDAGHSWSDNIFTIENPDAQRTLSGVFAAHGIDYVLAALESANPLTQRGGGSRPAKSAGSPDANSLLTH